jgi:hypothetical protein
MLCTEELQIHGSNIGNMMAEQPQAKRDKKRMERDLKRNTLNSVSIAMENPNYISICYEISYIPVAKHGHSTS